jgi:hypothetical protein
MSGITGFINHGDSTIVEATCPSCEKNQKILVSTFGLGMWLTGNWLIQDAFPSLQPGSREILMTGYHSYCWEMDFGFDDYESPDGF